MIYCDIYLWYTRSLSLFVNYLHVRVNFIPTLYSEGQISNRLPTATMIDIFLTFIIFSRQVFWHYLEVRNF